jgi:hypothetical protein
MLEIVEPSEDRGKPEPENLRLVLPGAVLFGKKCAACGGYLTVPKAGPPPETCSAKCRQKAYRMRKRIKGGGKAEPRKYRTGPEFTAVKGYRIENEKNQGGEN